MITDISYLEAGFSEEFSSLLNGNNEVENLNEGMFSKLKSLCAKSNGRKSNYKFKGHCDSHKNVPLQKNKLKIDKEFLTVLRNKLKNQILKKLLKNTH